MIKFKSSYELPEYMKPLLKNMDKIIKGDFRSILICRRHHPSHLRGLYKFIYKKRSNQMRKSKEMKKFLDNFTEKSFGKSKTECEEQNICVFCHNVVDMKDFRDDLSRKEYSISGLCQKCQDDTFGR